MGGDIHVGDAGGDGRRLHTRGPNRSKPEIHTPHQLEEEVPQFERRMLEPEEQQWAQPAPKPEVQPEKHLRFNLK